MQDELEEYFRRLDRARAEVPADVVQAGADGLKYEAWTKCHRTGVRPAPGTAGVEGPLGWFARPVAAAVWAHMNSEVEQLRAELEADRSVGHGAKHWHDTYQQAMNAVDEFFVVLLDLMPGAADEGMDAYDQIPRGIQKLTDRAAQAEAAAAVLQSAADETNRRINAALRTAADLHEFNSPEGEHLDGCPGCRLETELGPARPEQVPVDALARTLSAADVEINNGDYPTWDDLSDTGRDEYRKAARYLFARFGITQKEAL